MFGYIRVFKDELKFKDDALYKRHYCELCRSMGNYSEFSRLFLSYDITFFLMLGIVDKEIPNSCGNCGILKCKSHCGDGVYDFFAAFGIALLYHKLHNDILDGEFIKRFPFVLIKRAYKKVVNKYPNIGDNIELGLKEIVRLEKDNCKDYEYMSELFAKSIFSSCLDFFKDLEDGEIRLKIIEAVARCVYLIDIIDDTEKDFKKGQYNPLNLIAGKLAGADEKKMCAGLVLAILENANSLMTLLPYSSNTPIISNILMFGIPVNLQAICDKASKSTA